MIRDYTASNLNHLLQTSPGLLARFPNKKKVAVKSFFPINRHHSTNKHRKKLGSTDISCILILLIVWEEDFHVAVHLCNPIYCSFEVKVIWSRKLFQLFHVTKHAKSLGISRTNTIPLLLDNLVQQNCKSVLLSKGKVKCMQIICIYYKNKIKWIYWRFLSPQRFQ